MKKPQRAIEVLLSRKDNNHHHLGIPHLRVSDTYYEVYTQQNYKDTHLEWCTEIECHEICSDYECIC